MIRIPLNDMIERICKSSGLSEPDVVNKIEEKCKSLSGLISKEGAAHIIANELGIKLVENSGKIKDLFPGMRSVPVTGRVIQVYDVKEFSRSDGSAGKVGSFLIGDETGTIRIVSWGDQTKVLEELSEGKVIKISNVQVRENNRGYKEAHLTDSSKIDLDSDADIGEVKRQQAKRVPLSELRDDGSQVEVMGTVVQVFDPRFFEVCPSCSSRLKDHEGSWFCDEHGNQEPDYSYLLNVFIDDGSENIRVVLFRNQVEAILEKSKKEVLEFRSSPDSFEQFKTKLLGEQFKFSGRAKNNTYFNRLEFVANSVSPASAEEELNRLEK